MHTRVFNRQGQAQRAQNKLLLLPVKRATADDMSLQYHIALEALRVGRGYASAAQSLAEVMVTTFFLVDAGYGQISRETFLANEVIIADCFEKGRGQDKWSLDEHGYECFAALVNLHDQQLRKAPLCAILRAKDRLEAFMNGENL
jgi:hypothetical protein